MKTRTFRSRAVWTVTATLLGVLCSGAVGELAAQRSRGPAGADSIAEPTASATRSSEASPLRSPFAVSSTGRAVARRNPPVFVLGSIEEDEAEDAPPASSADRPAEPERERRVEREVRVVDVSGGPAREPRPDDEDRDDDPPARTPARPAETGIRTYEVERGDSWLRIAYRNGLTSDQLRRANPGVDPERIRIGQRLVIPPRSEATDDAAPREASRTHEVRSGESLWSIARRYGVEIQALRDANRLSSDRIRPGQRLMIPAASDR